MTSQNVDLHHEDFITKGRRRGKLEASFIINWGSIDTLQCRGNVIAKWDSFFVLQSSASGRAGITKWGKY